MHPRELVPAIEPQDEIIVPAQPADRLKLSPVKA
jgi:hypothetical protein